MSVHKTKLGKWEVRYREGTRNRSKTFDKKRDADAFDVRQKEKRQRGEQIIRPQDTPVLKELAGRFMARRAQEGIADSTLLFNASVFDKHVDPHLGHLRVADITGRRLDEWRGECKASPYMLNRAQEFLGQLLDYAKQLRYVEMNAARDLKRVAHKVRKGKTATPEQVEAARSYFLSKERLGYATLISVLAYVGLRPAEALGLQWSALQGRRFFIDSRASNGQITEGTKTGVDRFPEIPSPVLADLAQWRMACGSPEGLIFPRSKDGLPWRKTDWDNWRARWFRPAMGAAGLLERDEEGKRWEGDFRPYDLRHTCASLMIRSLAPPTEVADHMGHGLQVLFRVYAHDMEAMRGKPAEPIEQAIQAARGSGVRRAFGRKAS